MNPSRAKLLAALSPELVEAIEALVDERIRDAVDAGDGATASPWFSLNEAAAYLRISPRTLERNLERGRVRSSTIGRRRILRRDALDEFAAAREDVTPITPPRRRSKTLDPFAEEA